MCTGAEIALAAAAAGASGGGQMLNARQANKNAQAKINAKNNAMRQEIERQKVYQAANDEALNTTLNSFDRTKQEANIEDLANQREQSYVSAAEPAAEFGNVTSDAPQVVKTDIAQKIADSVAKSKLSAKALAKIGARADLFQNNGLNINQSANKIGTTNTLARGSLGVNQIEQQAAANNAGNKSSLFGDILSAAGAAASIYAGMGAPGLNSAAGATNAAGGLVNNPVTKTAYDYSTHAAAPIMPVW